jgi:NAD(P)-dependent dehydrogenase (short-subunit alcohol dehydrogenase family)
MGNEEQLGAVAEHIRGLSRRALPLKCDVRDRRAVERAVGQAAEELGGPHILVANAGGVWGLPAA